MVKNGASAQFGNQFQAQSAIYLLLKGSLFFLKKKERVNSASFSLFASS
jgi:hypothetical protein